MPGLQCYITKFPPQLSTWSNLFLNFAHDFPGKLGKTHLGSSIFGVSHVVAFRCHLGLTSLKVWLDCGYVKKFPEVLLLLLGGRDKGASWLQHNPGRFYILKEKEGRRGANKERKGKLEQERERKERKKDKAKY